MKFVVLIASCFVVSTCFAGLFVDLPDRSNVIQVNGVAKEQAVPKGQKLRMLVWNIYKNERSGLLTDLMFLSRTHEFSLLQESLTGPGFDPFLESWNGLAWVSAISFFRDELEGTGVANGSFFRTSSYDYIRSGVREPIIGTPKMIVVTQYNIEGSSETFMVANIHAINFVSTGKFQKHMKQLEEAVEGHKGPLVVAGDFNTRNKDRWKIMEAFAKRLNLVILPLSGDSRSTKLDNILVRGLEVHSGSVLNKYDSSDHLPLSMEFSLR